MTLRGQEKNAQPIKKIFLMGLGRSISVSFNAEDVGKKHRSRIGTGELYRLVAGAFIEYFAGFGHGEGRTQTQPAVFCMLYSNFPVPD